MGNGLLDFYKFYPDRSSLTSTNTSTGNKIKKTFNREYRLLNCLGKGGFGQVYDGRRRTDNSPVVIKFLPRARILNWGTFEGVCNHFS
jgi:serine/threonine protein kinase